MSEALLVKKPSLPKIFPGWWIVFTSGILNLWGYAFQLYGFSALFKPIATELGLSRSATSVAPSISRLEGGLESPVTGWLTDRYGPKWIVFSGVFLVGLGLTAMYFVNSLWTYYLVWGVILGTGINISLTLPLDTSISNWFVRKRGLAMSIRWMFSGISAVLVPFITWLIITVGWRLSCVVGGVVMWLVGLPLVFLFVKNKRPEYYGLLPDGAPMEGKTAEVGGVIDRGVKYAEAVEEVEFTLRQAIRTPTYWLLLLTQASNGLAMPAISIHSIPFMTDIGISPVRAASVLALMNLSGLPFRFIGGLITDRIKKDQLRFQLGVAYLIQAIGFGVYLLNQTTVMIYVWFIIYGIGTGMTYAPNGVIRARYFGRKAVGSIGGFSMMLMTPVGIAAPIYFGWVYDTTGNYISAFTLVAGLIAISAVVMSFIRPPKPPAVVTDVRKIL